MTGPLLSRSIGAKVPAKQIGRHTERVTRIGGTPKALCRLGSSMKKAMTFLRLFTGYPAQNCSRNWRIYGYPSM